jgi:hypothetical protein
MSDEESEDEVHIEGRKPFNRTVPRLATAEYEDRQPPDNYVSWQSKINSGPGGTIDDSVLEDYLNGVGSVYEEVEPKDIDKIPSGARFAYITKKNKFRSAGWMSRIEESTMDIDGKPFKKPKKFVLYKAYNNACFPVQVEDVEMFYVMMPKVKPIVKMIYFKKPTGKKTNFPVMLKNSKGKEVCVYMAKDNFAKDKFKSTNKYKKALEDPEGWDWA